MNRSIYFSSDELACRCRTPECDGVDIDPVFLLRVDRIRHRFGKPLAVTSGVRCKKHNMLVGGSARSQHVVGHALDLAVKKEDQCRFMDICREEGITGFGRADTWVHIDDRPGKFRTWAY
mgnify:CR=1 FL=1